MWRSGDSSIDRRLLLDMAECTNSGGYPLFDNRIVSIWEEERMHVWCLQDTEGIVLYTVTGHIMKGDRAASAPLGKRYYLTGITPPAPGQLCNITIILWSFSNYYNPTSSLSDSSWALQQAICTITVRNICWRACVDRIRPRYWQQPSNKIASKHLTCSWITRLMCSIFNA